MKKLEPYKPSDFMTHPKVKQARKLLYEAEKELRQKEKVEEGKRKCQCGHQRVKHGPSHNINYTGGRCKYKSCLCLNYL